jgi:GntR family transcriptional regulator, rspAB operon transcriptional repressor
MRASEPQRIDRFETARTKGNRLHARLYADILTGRLRPGETLSETRIAERHGISRTPVREVFQHLAKEGLLRVVPQIGTFVAPINLGAVNASQFIREALECRAVRQAAERITRAQLTELRRQIEQQTSAIATGDHLAFFALDEAMHRHILAIAGHPRVWDLIAAAKTQLDRVRHLSLQDNDWLAMIFRQHRQIVRCIAARDAPGAEQAMQAHLRTVFDAIERIAAAHAEFFEQEQVPQPEREIARWNRPGAGSGLTTRLPSRTSARPVPPASSPRCTTFPTAWCGARMRSPGARR